jgi:CubicO group peptidase (beta-lactamase class C family)
MAGAQMPSDDERPHWASEILSVVALVALVALVASCATSPCGAAVATARTPPSLASDPAGAWEIRWDRTSSGWSPAIFDGALTVDRDGPEWRARLAFKQTSVAFAFESLSAEGDHFEVTFHSERTRKEGSEPLRISACVHGNALVGEIEWGPLRWTPFEGRRLDRPQLAHRSVDHSLPPAEAEAILNRSALRALVDHATDERSSAVVILVDGKVAVELYRDGYGGGPLTAMSGSKSIVSLAIGMLIAEEKLSLDTTMDSLFPEWKNLGPKSTITVRQLLSHTSGLDPSRAEWSSETIREHALRAKLVFPPGSRFQYDNDAVDFLSVVFAQAAGEPLDTYLERRVFRKLDIRGAHWMKDSEGTPRGAGELIIRPIDFAKIGQLYLDGGMWHGERIVPAEWVARSVEAGQEYEQDCGLLWWREGRFVDVLTLPVLSAWFDAGVDELTIAQARVLLGKRFTAPSEFRAALSNALGERGYEGLISVLGRANHVPYSAKIADGPMHGFSARGWLGQFLVVLPESRVVAVRMRHGESSDYETQGGARVDENGYGAFPGDVARVFASSTAPQSTDAR